MSDEIDVRPIRKRMRPDRLGENATNYNDFFKDVLKPTTTTDSTPINGTIDNAVLVPTKSTDLTPSIGAIDDANGIQLLKLLLQKVNVIEDQLIKITVKINHMGPSTSDTRKVMKLASVGMDELRAYGLPLESESALKNFETKLKTDIDFKSKLVSNSI